MELLLRELHANPNVVDDNNCTTLMLWAWETNRNFSILKLLVKYKFDFAKLVNVLDKRGLTLFHMLCIRSNGNTDHIIACLKYLFAICEKIPNCSINILTTDNGGVCGLHTAMVHGNADMVRYLLKNVYFPNNNKLSKDGVAFMNMRLVGHVSLARFVMGVCHKYQNTKCGLEMFKLLVSYGMKVNLQSDTALEFAVARHHTEIAQFILKQNLCPIYALNEIIGLMYVYNTSKISSLSTEILNALYNYGLEHGVISNKSDHSRIITHAAMYNLTTFKATMRMILAKYEIKDLMEYEKCDIIDVITLKTIAQSPKTTPDVKSFINVLISDDVSIPNKVVLTCINNHELSNNNIINCKKTCSICGDNGDGSQSLSGLKCDECKSFICDDCIIVQTISKKMKENPHSNDDVGKRQYDLSMVEKILQHKNNKKLFNKVKH